MFGRNCTYTPGATVWFARVTDAYTGTRVRTRARTIVVCIPHAFPDKIFFITRQSLFSPVVMFLARAFSTKTPSSAPALTFSQLNDRRRANAITNERRAYRSGAWWWNTYRTHSIHWPFEFVTAHGYFRYADPSCNIAYRDCDRSVRSWFVAGLREEMRRHGDTSIDARREDSSGTLYFVVEEKRDE